MGHSSDYRYIYKPSGGNLYVAEVAICLGTEPALGNICTAASINPWSKVKPVRWPLEDLSSQPNWHQGQNGLCGFRADPQAGDFVMQELSSYANAILAGNYLPWVYEHPTGPLNGDPYRLLDFDGYWADAESPAGWLLTGATFVYDVSLTGEATIKVNFPGITDARNLKLSDFGGFSVAGKDFSLPESYIGVMLWKGRKWVAGTMQVPVNSISFDQWQDIPLRGAEAVMSTKAYERDINAVIFFSSDPITADDYPDGIGAWNAADEDLDALIISAFGVSPVSMILHRQGRYDLGFDSDVEYINNYVTGDVYIREDSGLYTQQINLTGTQVHICSQADVRAFEAGTISGSELLNRALNTQTFGHVSFTGSTRLSVNIYASEDDEGYDPAGTYYLVLSAAQLLQPVVSDTIIN